MWGRVEGSTTNVDPTASASVQLGFFRTHLSPTDGCLIYPLSHLRPPHAIRIRLRSVGPPRRRPSASFAAMPDNEKEVAEGSTSRGADWEVVTLTASAYAAAPGPGGGPAAAEDGQVSSKTLLMSDHFVFPPSEHENLPIETALEEAPAGEDVQEEESTSVEDAGFKSVVGGSGSERVQYYDEGKNLSADEAEMLGDMAEHGSFRAKDDGHGSAVHDDDDSQDRSEVTPDSKGRGSGGGAPCQCWVKKHMTSLYGQAKDTNALWSVVVAAAFVGLVILWRKDKLHIGCFKWRSSSAVR